MSRRSSLANNGLHSWLYDAAHNALVWGDITLTAVKVIIPLVCCARRRGDQTGGALHRCSRRAVENGNRIQNAAPAAQGLANGEGCRNPPTRPCGTYPTPPPCRGRDADIVKRVGDHCEVRCLIFSIAGAMHAGSVCPTLRGAPIGRHRCLCATNATIAGGKQTKMNWGSAA